MTGAPNDVSAPPADGYVEIWHLRQQAATAGKTALGKNNRIQREEMLGRRQRWRTKDYYIWGKEDDA